MTEAELLERLSLYLAAERRILEGGQSSTIAGTTFTQGDLRTVQLEITRLRGELALVQSGGSFGCQPVVFGGRR